MYAIRCSHYFGSSARGHWCGCEIRNHWVRDSQMLEDKTRIRDYKINANLATLRCCLLKLKAQLLTEFSWPEIIERAQLDQSFAYQLISNQRRGSLVEFSLGTHHIISYQGTRRISHTQHAAVAVTSASKMYM